MKKEFWKDSFYYLIFVVAASFVGLLVSLLFVYIGRFIDSFNKLLENIMIIIGTVIGQGAFLFVKFKYTGYQDTTADKIDIPHAAACSILSNLIYSIFNFIVRGRNPGVVVVLNITSLFRNYNVDLITIWTEEKLFLIIGLLIVSAVNVVFMLLGYYVGGKQRIADRATLTGGGNTSGNT